MMSVSEQPLEEYILQHIDSEPFFLKTLARETNLLTLRSHMMSGHLQGRLLKMFCQMVSAKRILEIGTFTGYSALCMAEALPKDGELHTIDIYDEIEDFLRRVFGRSEYGDKIHLYIGDALQLIPTFDMDFDVVFIDGNKRQYLDYYQTVFPKTRIGGLIIADNTLWNGYVGNTGKQDAQTAGICEFNDYVATDDRVEKVIVPIRDGMSLIRKIK